MIQLLVVIIVSLSMVVGFYGIALLHTMRKKHNIEYLNSFFYFQVLSFFFGIYGIVGNLLVHEFLPKFDIKIDNVEIIALFFPLLGLPFLIAGWYLQLKMVAEMCFKKSSQLLAIIYFFFTTAAFLLFGFYVLNYSNNDMQLYDSARKNIFFGFGLVEIILVVYMVSFLFINAISHKNITFRLLISRFAAILAVVTVFKAVSLYYSGIHFTIGLYYILLYFGGALPQIFLIKKYLSDQKINEIYPESMESDIYNKYKITPREKEIILEICKGKTNQQIADSLFISLQTVKDHTHNIFQKTGVKSRMQLLKHFAEK